MLKQYIDIEAGPGRTSIDKGNLENDYPGFVALFEALAELGCDKYTATTCLKYALSLSDLERLDSVLNIKGFSEVVTSAVALDLDEQTLVAGLNKLDEPALAMPVLPGNMSDLSD